MRTRLSHRVAAVVQACAATVGPRDASAAVRDPSEPMIPWGIALIFGAPFAILVAGFLLAAGIYLRRRRRRAAQDAAPDSNSPGQPGGP